MIPSVAGPSTKASGNDGWTTIARRHMPVKPWCLRSEDWGAPVVEYDQMAKSLTEAKGVFKAVVLCTPDQRDTLQELLKGTEKLHAVLCVTLGSGPSAEKCPGTNVGTSKPTFRQAVFSRSIPLVRLCRDPSTRVRNLRRLKKCVSPFCTSRSSRSLSALTIGSERLRTLRSSFTHGLPKGISRPWTVGAGRRNIKRVPRPRPLDCAKCMSVMH